MADSETDDVILGPSTPMSMYRSSPIENFKGTLIKLSIIIGINKAIYVGNLELADNTVRVRSGRYSRH